MNGPIVEHYEGLEATAANIRRLIGEDRARLLSEAFGGRRLYVPRDPGEHHPISVAIGLHAAAQLAAAFHGVSIDIPMLPEKRSQIRRLRFIDRKTVAAIAREVHCTERWVYKVCGESDELPSAQGRLFD